MDTISDPNGKQWVSENNISVGDAVRIKINTRLSALSNARLSALSNAYLPVNEPPVEYGGLKSVYRISVTDLCLFEGMVGAIIGANDYVLIGFTNGLEILFSHDDLEISISDLTPVDKLPVWYGNVFKWPKMESKEPSEINFTNGEIAFYDSVIVAMVQSGIGYTCVESHKRALALIENRRKLFNEKY